MTRISEISTYCVALTLAGGIAMSAAPAHAECSCSPGQTQYMPAAAHAYVVLAQNTKKSIQEVDVQQYYAPTCWAITAYDVYEEGLGTMGSVSWSSYPPNLNVLNNSQISNAHQSALDAMVDIGYQGQDLINAQAAINESFSNSQNVYNDLNASHSGVEIVARTSGRGRFTWKGRESAEATLNVTLSCVPDAFKSLEGMKSHIIQNAILPPEPVDPVGPVIGGTVIGGKYVNADRVKRAKTIQPSVMRSQKLAPATLQLK